MSPSSIEKPTVIERFVKLIPLPYPLAALIWSAMIPGSPGFYIVTLVPITAAELPTTLLSVALLFYLFLMVRYMRLRVVAAEAPIAQRLSRGDQDYHRAFERLTKTAPLIPLTAALGTLLLASYASSGLLPAVPWLLIPNVIAISLGSITFINYLWVFATASLGLHKLGGPMLRLGSFLEDRMMGSKPIGNLALSLTVPYYGGLLFTSLTFSTFLPSNLPLQILFITLLLFGVALFFLPLNSVHAKMQAEKRRLQREIGARYPNLNRDLSQPKETATLDDVHTRLAELTSLQEVEMLDRKIASLPTWPFDIQVVSKFITIVLSVTAVLLSRLITGFLHI